MQETIERSRRNFETYKKNLYLPEEREAYRGRILDVGAGDSNFAEVAAREYPYASIFRIDLDYQRKKPDFKPGAAAGDVIHLPYPPNTFDEVLASFSLIWVDRRPAQALLEMTRVARKGAKVKVYPVSLRLSPTFLVLPKNIKVLELNPSRPQNLKRLEITKPEDFQYEEWFDRYQRVLKQIYLDPSRDPLLTRKRI